MVVKRSNLSSGGAVKAAAATSSSPASMSFSLDQEFLIYQSCIRHKPAGLFKHFQMAMIHNHLKSGGLIPGVTPEALWDHLSGLYNLTRCDAIERKKPKKRAVDEEDLEDEEDMEVMDENEENEENQSQEWQEFELPKVEFDFAIKDIKKGAGSGISIHLSFGSRFFCTSKQRVYTIYNHHWSKQTNLPNLSNM